MSDDDLLAFVEGTLSADRRPLVETHLDNCTDCRQLVAAAAEPGPLRAAATGCAADEAASLDPGTAVGRYVLVRRVGEGAMGSVFSAVDPQLGRTVAVKVLHARLHSPSNRQRMIREARAMAQLSHPNVVPVFDVGECDAGVFIVMEFVDGMTLERWTAGRAWPEVVARYLECARGIAAAHDAGIVHRDFKPANVLIGADGRARVTDFGLAAACREVVAADPFGADSARSDAPPRLTHKDGLIGTPAYMSPERFRGQAATPASDQFSFCVALHEGLYGRRPNRGRTVVDLMTHAADAARHVSTDVRKAPPAIGKLLRVGLAAEASARFASMHEIVAALDRTLAQRGRRWRYGLAFAGATVLASAAWAHRGPTVCDSVTGSHSAQYGQAQRSRLRARLVGSESPYGAEVLARVDDGMSRFAAAWAASVQDLCDGQPPAQRGADSLAAGVECLQQQRVAFEAALDVLDDSTTRLDRMTTVVSGLPQPHHCIDPELKPRLAAPLHEASARTEATALQRVIAEVSVLHRAYQFKEGAARLNRVWDRVEALDHPPLVANALYWRAAFEGHIGVEAEERRQAEVAYAYAIEHGLDDEAGQAATKLMQSYGVDAGDFDAANRWARTAEGLAQRTGSPLQRARFLKARGEMLIHHARLGEGERSVAEAIGLFQAHFGGRPAAEVASGHGILGNSALRRRDYSVARIEFERQLDESTTVHGPSHPGLAVPLLGLAQVAIADDDLEEAQVLIDARDALLEGVEETVAIREVSSLRIHSDIAAARGDLDAALALARQAVAYYESFRPEPSAELSNYYTTVGNIHSRRADLRQAKGAHKKALEVCEHAGEFGTTCLGFGFHNLAESELALGEFASAAEHYERAIALMVPQFGESATVLAYPKTGLGRAKLGLGQLRGAAQALRQALRLLEADRDEGNRTKQWAEAAFALAQTQWRTRPHTEVTVAEALARATAAGEIYAAVPGYEREALAVSRWLESL